MGALQDKSVTVGGRKLTVRYSLRATLFLKEQWKLEEDREVQARMARAGMSDFVDIFWAGLQTHHRELTRDQVLDLLDEEGMEGLAVVVTDAITDSAAPDSPQEG